MNIFDNSSRDSIIKSISSIFNCYPEDIEVYLFRNREEDIDTRKFLNYFREKNDFKNGLLKEQTFDSLLMFHLTSRLSLPTEEPFLNLIDALTSKTELQEFFLTFGIIFEKEENQVITLFNGNKVNWKNYSSSTIFRIIKRLSLKQDFQDNCINGFLINDRIWEDINVSHIQQAPEFLNDIAVALQIPKLTTEWIKRSKTYVITLQINLSDLIFDENELFTYEEKVLESYTHWLSYASAKYNTSRWDPRFNNIIVRLMDLRNLSKEFVVNCDLIEQ